MNNKFWTRFSCETAPRKRAILLRSEAFAEIEEEINPGAKFEDRIKAIENSPNAERAKLLRQIKEIEREIQALPFQKLSSLIKNNKDVLEQVCQKDFKNDSTLFSYLVKNGFLDEKYYLFTSNFYEGRMSVRDRNFIVAAGNDEELGPEYPVDTPKEVCANMQNAYFSSKFILNVSLVDFLLTPVNKNPDRLKSALLFIAEDFVNSKEFLSAYFLSGKNIEGFIDKLFGVAPSLVDEVYDSSLADEIVSYILRFVKPDFVSESLNKNGRLSGYLRENGERVFTGQHEPPTNYGVLKSMGVQFEKIVSLEQNSELVEFAYRNGLFVISAVNILYLMRRFSAEMQYESLNIEKSNYTALSASTDVCLKEFVDENIALYVEDVFLALPENTSETEEVILHLTFHEEIKFEIKQKIIESQDYVFKDIASLPNELWDHAWTQGKVLVSWENIFACLDREDADQSLISSGVNSVEIAQGLSAKRFSSDNFGEEGAEKLSRFIYENICLDDDVYGLLNQNLPYCYQDFPEVSDKKKYLLAEKGRVRLTEESYLAAKDDNVLLTCLIEKNWNQYFENRNEYPTNGHVKELLLMGSLKIGCKIEIVYEVQALEMESQIRLAELVAGFVSKNEMDMSIFDDQVLIAAVENSTSAEVALQVLLKSIPGRSESFCMTCFTKIEAPYNAIASYGKMPKIPKTSHNEQLVELMNEQNYISSFKVNHNSIRVNTRKTTA